VDGAYYYEAITSTLQKHPLSIAHYPALHNRLRNGTIAISLCLSKCYLLFKSLKIERQKFQNKKVVSVLMNLTNRFVLTTSIQTEF